MIAFTDRHGWAWSARLDVAAAIRMRDLAGVDVMSLALGESIDDPEQIANAAYAILKPSADLRGVTPRQFGRRLRGGLRWAIRPEEMAADLSAEVRTFLAIPELLPGKPKGSGSPPKTAAALWGLIWTYAGIAGVDPGPHTFGELVAMADAKRKHDWAQTAGIMSFVSAVRGGKGEPASKIDPTGGLAAAKSSSGGKTLKVSGKSGLRMAAMIVGVQ